MPASGHQDHTASPSASRIARQARTQRPPHPAPRFVTLRNAPPKERDGCGYKVICVFGKSEYFSQKGWTAFSKNNPTRLSKNSAFSRIDVRFCS
jgi:hypothetical protein